MAEVTEAVFAEYVAHCPLCGGDHDGCVFTAGSLFCVTPRCANPHHRTPPEE